MVKTIVLRAPGTNCDAETVFAFEQAGSAVDLVHVNQVIRHERQLADYQILVIPGGFTYGDDIAAGKVLANEMKLKLGEDIRRFFEVGGLVLGICNGFQVLVKAGFLPDECRWVRLAVNKKSSCVFTKDMDGMYVPVAHGEGKFVAEPDILPHINVVVRYADEQDDARAGYPYNPNGSVDNIAGICDSSGRIFALMPHPERHIRGTQHPQWTRFGAKKYGDGFPIFLNAVRWVQQS